MSAMREDGMPHQSTFGLEVRQEIADDTDKPRVDIIAVHGLYSDYISTWDDGATDDLDSGWLCKAFPNAANIQHGRVMAYNYQSDLTANNILDELTLHAAAVTLLEAIEGKQTADEDVSIIFLCHNIGGIIVKKALWVANHEKRFLSTAHLARALILFATPSPSSAWDESLLNIVLATSGSAQRQKGLEVLLSTGCKALRTTSDRFESLLNQYKVETVAEILGTSLIGMMVPLDDPSITVDGDDSGRGHLSLCRSPSEEFIEALGLAMMEILKQPLDEKLASFLKFRQTITCMISDDVCDLREECGTSQIEPGTFTWATHLLNGTGVLTIFYGSPGAGKSTLARWVTSKYREKEDAITLSYQFRSSDYRRRTYRNFLLSCTSQLLYQSRDIFNSSYVHKLYNALPTENIPSCAELYRLLQALICNTQDMCVYFVIDSIDECNGDLAHLLGDMRRLSTLSSICRIVLTSRRCEELTSIVQNSDHTVDLDDVMTEGRSDYWSKYLEAAGLAQYKEHLDHQNTTMLHVKLLVELLHLRKLQDGNTFEFHSLPTLDEVYIQMIHQLHVQEVLLCLAFAERPLTINELSTALGIRPTTPTQRISFLEIILFSPKTLSQDLLHSLGSLLLIEDDTVRLVHDTLRDLIITKPEVLTNHVPPAKFSLVPREKHILGFKCWTFLVAATVENQEPKESLSNSALWLYVVQCWALHLQQITNDSSEARHFFWLMWDNPDTLGLWLKSWCTMHRVPIETLEKASKSPFTMACFLGLSKIAVSIAEKAEFENDGLLEGVKLALTADHINTVKVLLPQVMTSGEWSILIELCCQQCHIGLLRHMLSDEFSDLMPGEDELKERLGDAARNGFWPIVSCLVQAGAPLGHEKEDLKILKLAVQNGYEGALSELFAADAKWTLVEYPAAIHETDGEELYVTSLLHEAAEYGSAPVIKALVHSGRTSIDIKCGEWNASALHSTAKADYAEAAEALLEAGADTTTADDLGTSVLLLACIYSSEKVVRVLLSHGADPEQEIRTGSKWKPLQIAAYTGNKNLVRLLLEYGAFPDAVHSRHGTPLNIAVDRVGSGTIDAYCQVLELLLGFNANPNTQNNHGSTPLHLALKHDFPGMERVIRILKQHGADVDKCDNKGNSPLFYALQGQHQNIKLLWDHDSVVDFDADHILPLLMDAAGHGLKARIEMLLRLGGDKEQHQHQRDKFGRHAHDVAFDADIRHLLGAPDFIGENNDQDGMCPFVKRYLYPKQDKSTPLPDWYCDDCGKSMGSGLFLHCRDCGADCEEVQTFDVCQNCEAGDRVSSCRERDHRLRWRFIGQSLLSIEELSPNIADFKEEDSGTVSDDSMIDV